MTTTLDERDPVLRAAMAKRILTIRGLQRAGTFPRFWLGRLRVPRLLAVVAQDMPLGSMIRAVCTAWDANAPQHLTLPELIAQAEAAGRDLASVTLTHCEVPVPWEDYFDGVTDLMDEAPMSDVQYAEELERIWLQHYSRQLTSDEQREAYAQYLVLHERFGALDLPRSPL
jgi:hypothetical protein